MYVKIINPLSLDNRKAIHSLLTTYLNKQISREEFDSLFIRLTELEDDAFKEAVIQAIHHGSDRVNDAFIPERVSQLYLQIQAKMHDAPEETPRRIDTSKRNRLFWVAICAAATLLFLIGGALFLKDKPRQEMLTSFTPEEILPVNRARLKLPDGQIIELSQGQNGIVIRDGIRYLDGTTIVGNDRFLAGVENKAENESPTVNFQLSTPNGAQYQITLPDGTRVWLNAGSSIDYPNSFRGKVREVALQGEAYFEVTRDPSKPFVVKTMQQKVEVLGTSFNITAYDNEPIIKTTVLSGAVRVSVEGLAEEEARVIMPEHQSIVGNKGSGITVGKFDSQAAIAWKEGFFNFHGLSIDESMKQIERWYDVHVVYEGKIPAGHLGGKMSRGVKLSTFLNFLEKDYYIKSELKADRKLFLYTSKGNNE